MRTLLDELEAARSGAADDRQFGAATAAIIAKARLLGLDRENGNGNGGTFARCETVEQVIAQWLTEFETPAEALEALDTWREQVEAFAGSHAALVLSAEPSRRRPDEVGLALGYLRRRR